MPAMYDIHTHGLKRFEASAGDAARLLKALSSHARLMILCRIGDGEAQVGELVADLQLSQSALSQHLARLRADGVVTARREGTAMFYRIASPAAMRVIGTLADIYCPAP